MIDLPSILHSRRVIATSPNYLGNVFPPIVSYTYPKTVAGRVFNFKNANKIVGTTNMSCKCSTSPFVYTPAGHVVTGNLNIVKNKHVRKLLMQGPTYREQSNINWNTNEELCIDAVRVYRIKWAKNENVDDRVLADWKHEVVTCIKNYCKRKYTRMRKK